MDIHSELHTRAYSGRENPSYWYIRAFESISLYGQESALKNARENLASTKKRLKRVRKDEPTSPYCKEYVSDIRALKKVIGLLQQPLTPEHQIKTTLAIRLVWEDETPELRRYL